MLAQKRFFCTITELSVIDIVIYNEIFTVLVLTHFKLRKADYPNLRNWVILMDEIPEVAEVGQTFMDIIEKYELN